MDDRLAARGVRLWLKRDDLIHPELPGNKWRKLKYNLAAAEDAGHHTLLTFGGAFSNHVRAVAAAGHFLGFRTVGVIRGEEHLPLNPSLAYAVGRGMTLTYLDRLSYRQKSSPVLLDGLRTQWGEFFLVPEGGSNSHAVRGCAELPAEISEEFDVMCCPVGTGGTLAGIATGLPVGRRALGFSVLKGGEFLADDVESLAPGLSNWEVNCEFHAGGYAKQTPELRAFIADFAARHQLALDWVYVAKMMLGIFSLVDQSRFTPGTRLVAVITG
ncbi:pyridoxal-phosphate dependent enzyme [Longispora sp. K20-0274]|uniref:1-aminocyclopropane-1-carboxylate deaminase/D-cysteine desulfhydrase n=1 Tax=Longispora sp. K20-0274 TaxID=3088255 RepID=UPI003999FABE